MLVTESTSSTLTKWRDRWMGSRYYGDVKNGHCSLSQTLSGSCSTIYSCISVPLVLSVPYLFPFHVFLYLTCFNSKRTSNERLSEAKKSTKSWNNDTRNKGVRPNSPDRLSLFSHVVLLKVPMRDTFSKCVMPRESLYIFAWIICTLVELCRICLQGTCYGLRMERLCC